jgi:hypothetical protein
MKKTVKRMVLCKETLRRVGAGRFIDTRWETLSCPGLTCAYTCPADCIMSAYSECRLC